MLIFIWAWFRAEVVRYKVCSIAECSPMGNLGKTECRIARVMRFFWMHAKIVRKCLRLPLILHCMRQIGQWVMCPAMRKTNAYNNVSCIQRMRPWISYLKYYWTYTMHTIMCNAFSNTDIQCRLELVQALLNALYACNDECTDSYPHCWVH